MVKALEIEFNGISEKSLQEICDSQGISAEFFPLAKRDAICPREEGRTFGDGETYYIAEETCWHGYFLFGNIDCGRTSTRRTSISGTPRVRATPRKVSKRTSGCDCSGADFSGTDCDTGNDTLGAILIFIAIIAIIILLIALAPYLFTAAIFILELSLALILGLFDILTFGIFRRKFKRVLVYFPSPPSDSQLNQFIGDVAALGGLPRRYHFKYYTNGWWILRTGAYLFFPSLIAVILVLWLGTENGALFRIPIITFVTSILLVWLGNTLVNRKAKEIATIS